MMKSTNIGVWISLMLFCSIQVALPGEKRGPAVIASGEWTCQSLIKNAGLTRRYLFDIAFTKDQNAWIAASDGLHRYDGYSWCRFGKTNGLPSDFIRSVYVDRDNRLWVGSDHGAGMYDGTNYHSYNSEEKLAGSNVRRITQDREGILWFSCDRWPDDSRPGGLTSYKEGVWKSYSLKDGLPSDHVMSFFQDTEGLRYALTSKGVAIQENERWIQLEEPGLDTNLYSVSMVQSHSDTVFLQRGSGMSPLIRKGSVWKTEDSGGFGPLCITRKGEILNVHYDDPTQELYIQKWMGERFEVVSPKASYLNGWVERLAEAPDGSIWCIGPEVILRWEVGLGDWTQYADLPPPQFVDNQNRLWFSDEKSTYHLTKAGFEEVTDVRGSLSLDSSGNVWNWETNRIALWESSRKTTFESSQTGLAEIRGRIEGGGGLTWFLGKNSDGKFSVSLYSPPGWMSIPVPSILEETVESFNGDPTSGIWLLVKILSKKQQVLVHLTSETNQIFDVPSRITFYRDNQLHVDKRGIWVHGFSGLNRLNPEKSTPWTHVQGLLGGNVYLATSDSTRTVFTLDGRSGGRSGYAVITDHDIQQYPFDVDWFCARTEDGTFYLKHRGGMLAIPSNATRHQYILPLPQDGTLNGLVQTATNNIWVAISRNTFHYHPDRIPPETVLTVSEPMIFKGGSLRINVWGIKRWAPDYPQTAFEFSWTIGSNSWSSFQPYSLDEIPMNHLDSGTYQLKVRTRLEGREMDPTPSEAMITILPIPLQNRVWFKPALVCLFALLCLFAINAHWTRHKLKLVASRLEVMVNERTVELSKSNESLKSEIAEHKRSQAEKEKLQTQLLQAQKMESVGRLAGGVAHDFNNMLQAILGNAELALEELPANSPLRESLEEIHKSAERSADLTRQLLAFARKQTISPKILDLNHTISGILKILRRLIGEDIDLVWQPYASLWPVKMDPIQVDQILANLTVNARDAIVGVGKIIIETGNVSLDDSYVNNHPDCRPGQYATLTVSDTGRGIDKAAQDHLFEPFFTTKELGKGTGLGLATIFGIVKQNNGFINFYSEPGKGTAFTIFFPRAEPVLETDSPILPQRLLKGSETILMVEDEQQILNLGRKILLHHGYTVVTAQTPADAMAIASRYQEKIHLLITDVIMPDMNGKALYKQLLLEHPNLKCLFMSGYTADVIAHHGVLDDGVQFIQKPFTNESLAGKVREILDA